ncbi:zinc-dependent alcohol dehydrogenase [Amycolatopsis vancoresmycina]|uniref:Threonine dehydrogenase n=1 Tax=Amycolatopsis vancoresmycina DSM 44592 TaxID=1292037 RepID=R1HMW2_9PSEU|nr:zinc-binding alcohol dehydrogenase [Amycolatopsis vancoresmycina]EOD64885.1 threonine dehydrogenase [Amycolatopsis vancoresmycina DSM 44592]
MEQAFWVQRPGSGQLREARLPTPGPDDVLVRTLCSGVSRGTETLVFRGGVPASQHDVMRAPFQEGEFPGPVKYGYLNVGVVERGPAHLEGKTVFCLYPHQTAYVVPATAVTPVPDAVPPGRAILAGTVETAVNAVWDARPRLGDRIAVIGAGMVGASVAKLLTGFPATRVQLVDVDPAKAAIAAALGVDFATPEQALGDCDLVVHASASEAGLARALELLAPEGEVVELSWYGDRRVRVPLGENFHSRRLVIRSSQVGTVARPDRDYAERLAVALELLADPAFEALVSGECAFKDLPSVLPRLAANELSALCLRVMYQPQ